MAESVNIQTDQKEGPSHSLEPYNLLALFAFASVFAGVIPGIVLGHMGLRDLKTSNERGRGLALAAVIIGYVFIAFLFVYFIWIVTMIAFAFSQPGFISAD